MGVTFSQLFPPAPNFTETELAPQTGRVFLITGGTSGLGFELATILYNGGGKVYITARSREKGERAVKEIRARSNKDDTRTGQLDYLVLELLDLTTIKASAEDFLGKETKLDVLFNNAGISVGAPHGGRTKQGFNTNMGTNCLGPLLFTRCLYPALKAAAAGSSPASVRVIWTTSQVIEMTSPQGGFTMDNIRNPWPHKDPNYTASKLGNWFYASELSRELTPLGILSLVQNPGNLDTPLLDNLEWWRAPSKVLLYRPKMGAYTSLFAGLSPELDMQDAGGFIIPFGRRHYAMRQDLVACLKGRDEGGTGLAREFFDWSEEQIAPYR